MLLSKSQILAADDLPRELVNVPEWNGDVYVKALTAKERDDYEAGFVVQKGGAVKSIDLANVRARLVAMTIVDESGIRMFNDMEVFDLGRKSATALNRVYEVAKRLSGISQSDEEEMVKNSDAGQSGVSLTG